MLTSLPTDDSQRPEIAAKSKVERFPSRYRDTNVLIWPEPQVLTWVKARHMPWMLAGFEPLSNRAEPA